MKKKYNLIGVLLFFFSLSIINAATYDLKTAQALLKSEGFNPGLIDGFSGQRTIKAIMDYQAFHNLDETGELNQETWSSLTKEVQSNPVQVQMSHRVGASSGNYQQIEKFEQRFSNIEHLLNVLISKQPSTATKPIMQNKTPAIKVVKQNIPQAGNRFTTDVSHYKPKTTDKKLVIGVPAQRSVKHSKKKWGLLAKYLSANLEGYTFELRPLIISELYKQANDLDYILGNPKLFVQFEYNYGFRPIVTLRNLRLGKAYDRFGVVLFTKKDSGIKTIEDLKDKKMGMLGKKAWGGWVLGWHTMIKQGFDPYKEMAEIIPLGSHFKVIDAVREGKVDAGVVRTDILERLKQENDFTIINQNKEYGDSFPFQLSSKLYPEWVFAAGTDTNDIINRRIAALLLSLDGTSEVSKKGKNAGWTISANYQGVHTVLRDLNLPPYENYGKITFIDVLKKYWAVILLGLLLLLTFLIYTLYFRKLSRKLSQSNSDLISIQTKLVQSEKMAGIGTMIAGITHEINTPLAFAKSNITMIKDESKEDNKLLKEFHTLVKEKLVNSEDEDELSEITEEVGEYLDDDAQEEMINYVDKGLNSVSKLVLSLKNYSRVDRSTNDIIDLHEGLDDTLLIANNAIKHLVTIEKKYGDIPQVECSPSQINQVVMNTLMNAIHSIEEKKLLHDESYEGIIKLETWAKGDYIFLKIEDNGVGLKKGTKKQIFDPMFTTKEVGKGMGMGLSLSKQIIANHHGTISVESKENESCAFTIKLPVKQPKVAEMQVI